MSGTLDEDIAALPGLGRAELRERWRTLFKMAPPVEFTPNLLARGIASRLQEKALGGLSPEARRLLGIGGKGDATPRRRRSVARPALRLGNRLVRRWRGRTYVFEVTEARLGLRW